MLSRVQRLRGEVYLEDGALSQADLSPDGRHLSRFDEDAWHVLAVESGNRVRGCARYLPHHPNAPFSSLSVMNSALADDPQWGFTLRRAVAAERQAAARLGVAYAEVGGWAMDQSYRCTGDALRIALALYSLSRMLGGCIGLTTATLRHRSAATLQKIGGTILECDGQALPYYYDPQYRCDMAILRFQSDQVEPRFESWIGSLDVQLRSAPVLYFCASTPQPRGSAAIPAAAFAEQPQPQQPQQSREERRIAVAVA